MSTLLDAPATRSITPPADRLRNVMAAVRVSFVWLGTRKTLTPEQKAQAADTFGAEGTSLSAGKKLLDSGHPAFRALTAVRTRLITFWKDISLPYPEPGIRLIRQSDIAAFNVQLTTLKAELEEAVWRLDEHYEELKSAARERLGRLSTALVHDTFSSGMLAGWRSPADFTRRATALFRAWQFVIGAAPIAVSNQPPRMHLHAQIFAIADLSLLQRDQMFAIMDRHFECMQRETFERDLAGR